MPTRDADFDYDLSQWMRGGRSTAGLYGPTMVAAWQLALLSAVLWGLAGPSRMHLSSRPSMVMSYMRSTSGRPNTNLGPPWRYFPF